MRIGFVYDVSENIFGTSPGDVIEELTTELFSADQANDLIQALKSLGHQVTVIDGAKEFTENITSYKKTIDFVFNEAKGLFGPDRKMVVPALCRIYGIPYLGSDAYTVTLARNKWHTLAVATACGKEVPQTALCDMRDSRCHQRLDRWSRFPAIVKPNFESSSIGIDDNSVITNRQGLKKQVKNIVERYQQPALIQEFIFGIEVQASFIGTDLPIMVGVTEVKTEERPGFGSSFVRNQDWLNGKVEVISCLDPSIAELAFANGESIYRALGIRDYGRIDFRVNPSGRLIFIEAATHPHITPGSSFHIAAQMRDWSFIDLIYQILSSAQQRCKPPLVGS